ncbi:MAG: hypothetical protein ACMUIU_18340, partial [bacterium]
MRRIIPDPTQPGVDTEVTIRQHDFRLVDDGIVPKFQSSQPSAIRPSSDGQQTSYRPNPFERS